MCLRLSHFRLIRDDISCLFRIRGHSNIGAYNRVLRGNWVTLSGCEGGDIEGDGRWGRIHEEFSESRQAYGTGEVEGNVSGHQRHDSGSEQRRRTSSQTHTHSVVNMPLQRQSETSFQP